eukprot:SAG22_NODE_940_length_6402_cov_34.673172_8_plen_78_part_00
MTVRLYFVLQLLFRKGDGRPGHWQAAKRYTGLAAAPSTKSCGLLNLDHPKISASSESATVLQLYPGSSPAGRGPEST